MISLRDMTAADQEKVRIWRNLPEVSKYMFTDHVISAEEHAAWFRRVINDPSYKCWIIVCDGADVGVIWLFGIDRHHLRCDWGFYLADPNLRHRGVGSVAWYSVLNFVFDELKLNKLCAQVVGFNHGVREMHRKFGFVQEGHLRKHILKAGNMEDVFCFGMLREEWEHKRGEMETKLRVRQLIS